MSVIDSKAALERLDNDIEIYLDLIETFLDLGHPDFEEMKKGLRDGNKEHIARQIHQLKGAALTLGAEELAHSCALLESMLRNGTEEETFGTLEEIKNNYVESIRELAHIRDTIRKHP